MSADTVTFHPVPALISGLVAGLAVLLMLFAMLARMPYRFPLNPLYLIGSAFSIDTTVAYAWGAAVILAGGAGYGLIISAAFTGFEVDSLEFLWGAAVGSVLSIVSGTTLAYSRTLNRAVRAGEVGDPGPFLLRYGRWSMAQFLAAHAVFGMLTGALYRALS